LQIGRLVVSGRQAGCILKQNFLTGCNIWNPHDIIKRDLRFMLAGVNFPRSIFPRAQPKGSGPLSAGGPFSPALRIRPGRGKMSFPARGRSTQSETDINKEVNSY